MRLGDWLQLLSWPAGQRRDIEAAVSEAVSNVVEHAYGPKIDDAAGVAVTATLETLPDGFKRILADVAAELEDATHIANDAWSALSNLKLSDP